METTTVFDTASVLVAQVRSPQGTVQTREFLQLCEQVIPIVAKLGTGFVLVKSDIGGNIDRLAKRASVKPEVYYPDIYQIIRDEVKDNQHTHASSCTKGLLWLKRAMEFIAVLLQSLEEDRTSSLSDLASKTYQQTLYPYHGWLVSGTFTVALKFAPGRGTFMTSVAPKGMSEDIVMTSMRTFCVGFTELLAEIHSFLDENGLDDPTKV